MGRKCIVRGCKSNYNKSTASQNENIRIRNEERLTDFRKIPMFGFPSKNRDKLKFEDIANTDRLTLLGLPIVTFQVDEKQWIQSGEFIIRNTIIFVENF